MVLSACVLYRKHSNTPIPKLFTDHAAAQEGRGFRLKGASTLRGDQWFDAAHLMNTTLVRGAFASTGAPDVEVEALYRASSATTNQFQTSNVSSDKLIDARQTAAVKTIRAELNGGAAVDRTFVESQLDDFLMELVGDLQKAMLSLGAPTKQNTLKIDSYSAALSVVQQLRVAQLSIACDEIMSELQAYEKSLG